MIDWNKPIETMEGWPAKVISTDYQTVSQKLHLVQIERPYPNQWGRSILGFYMEDGRPWETQHHIRNAPIKREGWAIKKKGSDRLWHSLIYSSKENAEKNKPDGGVVFRMEWEE